jgi:hypothetical protein
LSLFAQSFAAVRETSNVCIVSCVTNFIADSKEEESSSEVGQRVDPILSEYFRIIIESCKAVPVRFILICPPMYRRSPLWYRDGLPEVMTRFSNSFAKNSLSIRNLFALPGFATPAFEADGVHLTPYSGYQYVLHLFSRAQVVLDAIAANPDSSQVASGEDVRALQDRVMATEQDLRRLSSELELKTAHDAELACYRANERNEDSLIFSGLPKIRSGLSGSEWQAKAKDSVFAVLKKLTPEKFSIIVVHNVTSRASDAIVTYSVRLSSVEASRSIRSSFSGFFKGGTDSRPTELKNISISNVITRETRIRISILKLFAKRYLDSNPGSKVQVIGYEPRPLLRLTPPADSAGKASRVQTYTFMEAVKKLPATFSDEEVGKILRQASSQFPGRLRSLFVVLSDDRVGSARNTATRNPKRGAEASGMEPPRQRHAS